MCTKGSNLLWPELHHAHFQKDKNITTWGHGKMIVCTYDCLCLDVWPDYCVCLSPHFCYKDNPRERYSAKHLESKPQPTLCPRPESVLMFSLGISVTQQHSWEHSQPSKEPSSHPSNLSCYVALTAGKSLVHTPSALTLMMGLSQHRQSNSEEIQTQHLLTISLKRNRTL